MATTLRNLLDAIDTDLVAHAGDRYVAEDAVAALRHTSRALTALATDGFGPDVRGPRETAVHDLAAACRRAAWAYRGLPEHRVADLAAAAADLLGRIRQDTGCRSRWDAAVSLADTVRHLATAASLIQDDPDVTSTVPRVHDAARAVGAAALKDPLAAAERTLLDRPVPVTGLGRLPGVRVCAESIVVVAAQLRGHVEHGIPITVHEAIAATHTAQAITAYTSAVWGPRPEQHPRETSPTAAWVQARDRLAIFYDGRSNRPEPSEILRWSVRACEGLRAHLGRITEVRPDRIRNAGGFSEIATELRAAVNQLPSLAVALAASTHAWALHGAVLARADKLPHREERTVRIIARRWVVADGRDLQPASDALAHAGRSSASLAVHLDQSANRVGLQPHPGLIAFYRWGIGGSNSVEHLRERGLALGSATGVPRESYSSAAHRRESLVGDRQIPPDVDFGPR